MSAALGLDPLLAALREAGLTVGVAEMARHVAHALKMTDDGVRKVYLAGLLHDIGILTAADILLYREGPLTAEELRQVRAHTAGAEEVLRPILEDDLVADKGTSKTSGIGGLGLKHADVVAGKVDLTEAQIDTLLGEDLATARTGATSLLPAGEFAKLSAPRQDALTELVFNMGVKSVAKFTNMLTALAKGDNATAVKELLTGADGKSPSKWLTDVHEMRAARVAAAIMGSQGSSAWLIGLVVSTVSLVLAALLWSSRRL